MVDWRGKPRIFPDYRKSCFELALEILTNSTLRLDDFGSFLSLWLIENLQLREDFEIEIRTLTLSSLGPDPPAPAQEGPQTRHTIPGYGYTLVSRGSKLGLYMPYEIDGHPMLETAVMQHGDTAIRFVNMLPYYNCMIVAREQSEGYFALIGYTACEDSLDVSEDSWAKLSVYLDSEDLLMLQILNLSLLELSDSTGKDHVKGNAALARLLRRRVCRFKGSSYAVRDNEY
jgi:hypothetical protein